MILYGLLGFTHNGGRTLTVMSPEGAGAALAAIAAGGAAGGEAGSAAGAEAGAEAGAVTGAGVAVQAGPGQLTYYQEKRRGALQALIAANGIAVLDKPAWDAKKAELGPSILD